MGSNQVNVGVPITIADIICVWTGKHCVLWNPRQGYLNTSIMSVGFTNSATGWPTNWLFDTPTRAHILEHGCEFLGYTRAIIPEFPDLNVSTSFTWKTGLYLEQFDLKTTEEFANLRLRKSTRTYVLITSAVRRFQWCQWKSSRCCILSLFIYKALLVIARCFCQKQHCVLTNASKTDFDNQCWWRRSFGLHIIIWLLVLEVGRLKINCKT